MEIDNDVYRNAIKDFAVNTLGCGCDNSVFSSIKVDESSAICDDIILDKKILIGNRLLIYVADSEKLPPSKLGMSVTEGLLERNSNNYNRLRIVIVSPQAEIVEPEYISVFNSLPDRDDKTHLHVISINKSI